MEVIINQELRDIISYGLGIFVCMLSMFIPEVSLVSCAAAVFNHAAAVLDGRKDWVR